MHRKQAATLALFAILTLSLMTTAQAQVAAPKPPEIRPPAPRLEDGTPNLGRVEIGKGYWALEQHRVYKDILVGATEIPYRPWAEQLAAERAATDSRDDPQGHCLPPMGPRLMTTPYPMEIVQIPQQQRILMIYEGGAHIWREIYLDGRDFPEGDELNPTWMGYSIGHWEGDTLVVEVRGFNEKSWLNMTGDPHTDQLTIVERYTRTDLYTLHYEATLDDPGAYTAPWTVAMDIVWDPEGQLQEYICQENNMWQGSHLNQ